MSRLNRLVATRGGALQKFGRPFIPPSHSFRNFNRLVATRGRALQKYLTNTNINTNTNTITTISLDAQFELGAISSPAVQAGKDGHSEATVC